MKAVLDIDDLTVSYQGSSAPAVEDFSCTVKEGEVVGLIGESGSGKSTVAFTSMGLLPRSSEASATSFSIAGQEVTGLDESSYRMLRGRKIAMVFQEPMTALNPTMTVGAQVAETVRIHDDVSRAEAWRRAIGLLDLVKLPDAAKRAMDYPHQFSGGQRQRILIASAVAAHPQILVADEPTTALDVTIQSEILDLLLDLRTRLGMGILLITHDLGVVAKVCDRVAVMYRGRLIEEGMATEVLRHPRADYTKALLACIPRGVEPPRSRLLTVADFPIETPARGSVSQPVETPQEAEAGDELLRFVDVSYRYGKASAPALEGVSLSTRAGRTLGVVGESGSGKSTLAKLALAIYRPDVGKVLYRGEDVHHRGRKYLISYRHAVQMVFQDPNGSFDPRLLIRTSLLEPLRRLPDIGEEEARDRVHDALSSVGFEDDVLGRVPAEFSGGQRQRLAIARALVTRPEVIVLDEPTSALDVSVQAQVLNLLVDLQRRFDIAYVFISHNLAVVRHMSHEVAVMQHGRIVEAGPSEEIFESPQDAYTKRLLASIPQLP